MIMNNIYLKGHNINRGYDILNYVYWSEFQMNNLKKMKVIYPITPEELLIEMEQTNNAHSGG